MPSLVDGTDRQTVKRTVPKASNKIHAVAIAKLYVAHPDKHSWTYTGLQGAAVLADDLVGNTFWIKLVDISPANRGVIWDQELYDSFQYNQDRTYFHTFELEDCLAGLSFSDEKEAKQFKKKMDEREKNADKKTRAKPFSIAARSASSGNYVQEQAPSIKQHSRFGLGGVFGHRKSSAPTQAPQSIIPPAGVSIAPTASFGSKQKDASLQNIDPALLDELLALGLTEDQLADNADFIRVYVEGKKSSKSSSRPTSGAPPPPPPQPITPQDTGAGSGSRRGPPPAVPPTRRGAPGTPQPPSPPDSAAEDEPAEPAKSVNRVFNFRAPPPPADAGKFASSAAPAPARKAIGSSAPAHPGPPPPPRDRASLPPAPPSRNALPPPPPMRQIGGIPPAIPARDSVPPPPPSRNQGPPVLPPKTPMAPPLPPHNNRAAVPPPAPPPRGSNRAPTHPPMPTGGIPPPPPAPPMQMGGGPLPPPPPPGMSTGGPPAPALPVGGLLADIQKGARLKKVSAAEKNDRSAAAVPGAPAGGSGGGYDSPAAPSPGPGGAGEGGLAGALASALAARKSKVSHSDDEDDDDAW